MADEKVYTIPLRKAYKKAPVKRVPYSIKLIKSYLQNQTKADEVKIGKHLNEEMWKRGIKKIPSSIRVKAVMDGPVLKAELIGHQYIDFVSKKKEEKAKGLMNKMKSRMTPKEIQKMEQEKIIEGKTETKEETKETKAETKTEEKPAKKKTETKKKETKKAEKK